jgi:hypothetical protein
VSGPVPEQPSDPVSGPVPEQPSDPVSGPVPEQQSDQVPEQQNAASKPSSTCTDETNCDPAGEAGYTEAHKQKLYEEYQDALHVFGVSEFALKDANLDADEKHQAVKFFIQNAEAVKLELANAHGKLAMANEELHAVEEDQKLASADFEAKRQAFTVVALQCQEAEVEI